jgi:hypothetical protein
MNLSSLIVIPIFFILALIIGFIYKAIIRNESDNALDIGIDLLQYLIAAAILLFMAYNIIAK